MFRNFLMLFFDATTDVGPVGGGQTSGGEKPEYTAEDDLKFLRQQGKDESTKESEEEDAEEVPDVEGNEESEEEDSTDSGEESEDEGTEDEDEDKEDEETDEEKEQLQGIVTAKDLKEKFPDVFKKVPELRGILYREQQYSQLFGSPQEAQDALTRSETFQEMENDLVSGESFPLLEALKKTNDLDFDKFASGLLPSLQRLDKDAYYKVVMVPFKQILRSAIKASQKNGDKNLGNAALHLHNFVFDNTDVDSKAEYEREIGKKSPEREEYEKKLNELNARDHGNFKMQVDSEWLEQIQKSFFDGFDPDNVFSDWTKKKMFEDAVGELNKQLVADTRYMKNLDMLWKNARANGFKSDSKSRIVATALARAKQILPSIRTRLRSEALSERRRINKSGERRPALKVSHGNKNERREQRGGKDPRKTNEMSELDIIRSR